MKPHNKNHQKVDEIHEAVELMQITPEMIAKRFFQGSNNVTWLRVVPATYQSWVTIKTTLITTR